MVKKAASFAVAALLAGAIAASQLGTVPAHADDQALVNQIQSQLDKVADQLTKAQITASDAQARYDSAVDKMSDLQLQADKAEKDVETTKALLDEATDRVAQLAASSTYVGASAQQLGTLLGAGGITDALRDAQALEQISAEAGDTQDALAAAQNQAKLASERQSQVIKAQRTAISEMEQAKSDADAAVGQLKGQQASLSQQRSELIAKIALAKKIAEEKAREEQKRREEERARQIKAQEQQEAAEKAQREAAAAEGASRGGNSGGSGDSGSSGSGSSGSGSSGSGSKSGGSSRGGGSGSYKPSGGGPSAVPAKYRSWVGAAGKTCPAVGSHVLAAQLAAESGWNPNAVSYAGAQGLAQFMPGTWAAWGRDADGNGRASAFDPGDAIMTQAAYMCAMWDTVSRYKQLGKASGDTLSLTLAAYNAGPGSVLRYGGVPPYGQTRAYISRIKSQAWSKYA